LSLTTWRLTRSEYAATALSGEGSARYPGRWNPRGIRVVYTSESLSLATLEILAHAENLEMLNQYVALRVDLPSTSMTTLTLDALPEDWQSNPPPESTRQLGLDWFRRQETLVLKVPSVLIPSEHNFIINPHHPAFDQVAVAPPVPLPFDARILSVMTQGPT
jgi:RES domain-containing protein